MTRYRVGFFGLALFIVSLAAQAADVVPPCMSHGSPIGVDNQQVLKWKHTTANQFLERAHVQGPIVQIYPDHSGHNHFAINIGTQPDDMLEVIYNQDFGSVPAPTLGMIVEACGDYITSTAQSGPYPASPAGAIIHWVHANPSGHGHDSGFLVFNGQVCGQNTHVPPRHSKSFYDFDDLDLAVCSDEVPGI